MYLYKRGWICIEQVGNKCFQPAIFHDINRIFSMFGFQLWRICRHPVIDLEIIEIRGESQG
jgi:hypothetical protein